MRTVIGIGAIVLTLFALQHGQPGAALLLVLVVAAAGYRGKRTATGHAHAGPITKSARHEAGHIAAAKYVGGTVTSARLNQDGSGRVDAMISSDPCKRVAFLLAGAEAAGTTRGAGEDFAQVDRELAVLPPAERAAALAEGRRIARRAVASRSEIDHYATRLQERGQL